MNELILGLVSLRGRREGGAGTGPYRGAFHDVPPHGFVPAALAEVQQVVHHHLSDQVVSGEAVEVVDGEMKLPGM